MKLRPYHSHDLSEVIRLFHDTVHSVNAKDYSQEQLDAWAPDTIDSSAWDHSLQEHFARIAESDGHIVGFGNIDATGYLGMLFVHKDHQRQGIACAITDALEDYARIEKLPHVTVHASLTAKPFFEVRGYQLICEQQVERRGVTLSNFFMIKTLAEQPKEDA